MSKTLHRNLQAKIVALQGPEWDSSDDEQENVSSQVKTTTTSKKKQSVAERKRAKKQSNKKNQTDDKEVMADVDTDEKEDPNVIYIGHLPNEFEEADLRTFLSQFGKVENSRISRSVKTGGSRGYAFVKFADAQVAKIVADTMQGYFLGKRRLVCHVVPDPDDGMFYNTDKLINRRKNMLEAEKKRREQNLASASKMKEITDRLVKRERKKRKKLQELGIDYDFPGYEANIIVNENEENETEQTPEKKKKKRKDSISSEASETKKSKRKDSISSETISSETSATKKSKRKDSISSEASESKKSKRKDSVGSETSESKKSKKRKDSIGSVDSNSSKRRKRANSEGSLEKASDAEAEAKKVPQSEKKKKKKKKSKSRRMSAP